MMISLTRLIIFYPIHLALAGVQTRVSGTECERALNEACEQLHYAVILGTFEQFTDSIASWACQPS